MRLPLHFFDNLDLERHDGHGWAVACAKLGREPNAVLLLPDPETGPEAQKWTLGRVTGWDAPTACFSAQRVDQTGRPLEETRFMLPRLSVMFLTEPVHLFARRLAEAHKARDECEAMLLLQALARPRTRTYAEAACGYAQSRRGHTSKRATLAHAQPQASLHSFADSPPSL